MTANAPLSMPENLQPLRTELAAFYRELPRLLDEGCEGKLLVVKGDDTFGVWDTVHDALQYAYEKFPDGHFLTQKIDRRFLDALAPYFPSDASAGANAEAV